eukprot:141593_1
MADSRDHDVRKRRVIPKNIPLSSRVSRRRANRERFKNWLQAQRGASLHKEPSIEISVAAKRYPINAPPISLPEDYIRVRAGIAPDCSEIILPKDVFMISNFVKLLLTSEGEFKEQKEHVIEFPMIRPAVMERAVQYCFLYFNECFATFRSDDLKDHQSFYLDEKYMISLHFPVSPMEAFDLLQASHYLGIAPLFQLCTKMIADHIDVVPDITGLSLDICMAVLRQLSPEGLYKAEKRPDIVSMNIDTTSLWHEHLKLVDDIQIGPESERTITTLSSDECRKRYFTCRIQVLTGSVTDDNAVQFIEYLKLFGTEVQSMHSMWPCIFNVCGIGFSYRKYLECIPNVRSLTVSGCSPSPEDNRSVFEHLATHRIGHFEERNCNLDDQSVEELMCALTNSNNDSLTYLDLCNNAITSIGLRVMFAALHKTRLKTLDICRNMIRGFIVQSIPTDYDRSTSSLTSLNLTGNLLFGTELPPGSVHIFDILPHSISTLILDECRLTQIDWEKLNVLPKLCYLSIKRNKLPSSVRGGLVEMLVRNESLKKLDLSCNYLNDDFLLNSEEWLFQNTTLSDIVLVGNSFGASSLASFAHSLRSAEYCHNVAHVAVSNMNDGAEPTVRVIMQDSRTSFSFVW